MVHVSNEMSVGSSQGLEYEVGHKPTTPLCPLCLEALLSCMCSWEGEVLVVDGGGREWCVGMVMVGGVGCCGGLV
jgi:hypothetical protein